MMGSKRGQQTATKELTIAWQGMAEVGGGQWRGQRMQQQTIDEISKGKQGTMRARGWQLAMGSKRGRGLWQ
jgi:hypothetical protein